PELLAVRKMNVDRSRHRDHIEIALPEIKATDGRLYAPSAKGGGRPREVYVQQCLKGEPLLALMRVLGAYVAEGNANLNRANGGYQVCIANDDPAYLCEIQNDAELFTNAATSSTWRKKPGSHQLTFSSKIIYLLVTTLCGAHSYEKRVPDALFTLVDEYKHAFLDNYLRGDGNTQRYKTVETRRLATNSPRLAAGLGLLLSMLDLDYSLNYPQQRPKRWRPQYAMNIVSTYDARGERKYSEAEYHGYVYDLTVEDAHNFAAGVGNVVVHNTHVDRSLRAPGAFLPTDQQFRPLAVPREGDPDLRHQRPRGPVAAALRRRTERPRLALRAGQLCGDRPRAPEGPGGRGLQHRWRARGGEHRPDTSDPPPPGQARNADPARQGSAWPRPALRARLEEGPPARLDAPPPVR